MLKCPSHMVLLVWFLPAFINGLMPGETGRYQYPLDSDPKTKMYCLWCKSKYLQYSQYRHFQVQECIRNNFPFNKTDKYEQEHELRPICNDGVLPTCPPLPEMQNGTWDCQTDRGYIFSHTKVPPYQTCTLNCEEGFEPFEGQMSIYCNESRLWLPHNIPKCIFVATSEAVYTTESALTSHPQSKTSATSLFDKSEIELTSHQQRRTDTTGLYLPVGIAASVLVVVVVVPIVVLLCRRRCIGKMDPEC